MKMAENDHESTLLSQTTPHFPAQLGSRDLPLLPLQKMADSTVYSSLQLWERISSWQCREYQGKPNEALLCKMFGAVFIPDGIV